MFLRYYRVWEISVTLLTRRIVKIFWLRRTSEALHRLDKLLGFFLPFLRVDTRTRRIADPRNSTAIPWTPLPWPAKEKFGSLLETSVQADAFQVDTFRAIRIFSLARVCLERVYGCQRRFREEVERRKFWWEYLHVYKTCFLFALLNYVFFLFYIYCMYGTFVILIKNGGEIRVVFHIINMVLLIKICEKRWMNTYMRWLFYSCYPFYPPSYISSSISFKKRYLNKWILENILSNY